MLRQIILHIFLYTAALSFVAAVLVLLLFAVRRVTSRWLGHQWQYEIWQAVLTLVFVSPIFLLLYGVFGASSITPGEAAPLSPQTAPLMQEQAYSAPEEAAAVLPAALPEALETPVLAGQTNFVAYLLHNDLTLYLALAWLLISCLLLFGRVCKYRRFAASLWQTSYVISWQDIPLPDSDIDKMRCAAPGLTLRRQKAEALPVAPLLIGLINPCILLPAAELKARDWHNILKHELNHLEHKDLWFKWIMLIVKSCHWFNPAIYMLERQLEQECEIVCDLKVTGFWSQVQRQDYMRTILLIASVSVAVPARNKLYTGINTAKDELKRRFEVISKHKAGRSNGLRLLAGILTACVLCFGSYCGARAAGEIRADENNLSSGASVVVMRGSGEKLQLANEPFVAENGRIYLPLREVLEKLQVIEPNDTESLQYENGLVKLMLYQWQTDAAGGRVRHCFYKRQFSLTDSQIGAQMRNDVIYVPEEMLFGIVQMSAADGGSLLDGLMILQYAENSGEIMRMLSLPLLSEDKTVHTILPLPEQFAVANQFLQAWRHSDYQKMQSFCTPYVLESVGWQYADVMLGEAVAVYAAQRAAEPNSLDVHALIIRPDGKSSFSELSLILEVEQQQDGSWLIGGLRSSNRDNTPLSENSEQHWQWPLDDKYRNISYGFGGPSQHSGIDIPAVNGAPVYAAAAGQVLAAGYMGEDGNKVILRHSQADVWETRYSHLSSIAVAAGDMVEAGQIIGYVGSTGKSTGNHLHFVIMHNGQALDPLELFE